MALGSMKVSGKRSADDWKKLAAKLSLGKDQDLWGEAFTNYFLDRLNTRYLEPIKWIGNNRSLSGEGFAIVTLQCCLIEFLQSTLEGKTYRQNPPFGDHEYGPQDKYFVKFLRTSPVFGNCFNEASAKEFYKNVRCALVHEARTKEGWRIWAGNAAAVSPIDTKSKMIFHRPLQSSLIRYIDWFGRELLTNTEMQKALLRKLNYLFT